MKFFIKYIVPLFLVTSSFAAEDGWFPVEQPAKSSFEKEKDDLSIWVVFRKNVGAEQFLVRFPQEPIYQVVNGQFQASSAKDGEEFSLVVFPRTALPEPVSRVYQVDGKWISEQVHLTEEHVYLFRTVSERAETPSHQYFFQSFSVR